MDAARLNCLKMYMMSPLQQAQAKLGMCLGHLLIVAPIFFAITIICLRHTSPSSTGLRALQISGLVLLSLMSLGCLFQVACSLSALYTMRQLRQAGIDLGGQQGGSANPPATQPSAPAVPPTLPISPM